MMADAYTASSHALFTFCAGRQGTSSVPWLRCHSGNAADPGPRRRRSAGRQHLNANGTEPTEPTTVRSAPLTRSPLSLSETPRTPYGTASGSILTSSRLAAV
jgi:hypothetical protein